MVPSLAYCFTQGGYSNSPPLGYLKMKYLLLKIPDVSVELFDV